MGIAIFKKIFKEVFRTVKNYFSWLNEANYSDQISDDVPDRMKILNTVIT